MKFCMIFSSREAEMLHNEDIADAEMDPDMIECTECHMFCHIDDYNGTDDPKVKICPECGKKTKGKYPGSEMVDLGE